MSAPAQTTAATASDLSATAAAVAFTVAARSRNPSSAGEQCNHPPSQSPDDPHAAGSDPAPTPNGGGSSSSGAAADPIGSDPSPASRLYRHALESILAFSDRKTLSAAVRVAKDWMAAVGSMCSLALKVEVKTALIESIAASVIGRHVADLIIHEKEQVTADAMNSIGRLMPHLRSLQCSFPTLSAHGPLLLSAGLRMLHLWAIGDSPASDINAAIEGAGRLQQLRSLTLRLRRIEPLVSFAPLATLPLLRSLAMFDRSLSMFHIDAKLTDAQVAELRALPRLRCLHMMAVTTGILQRLLAEPHDLQWRRLRLPAPLCDDNMAALLPQLPSLTAIDLQVAWLADFGFLQRLPNLVSVQCDLSRTWDMHRIPMLLIGLFQCANITDLQLANRSAMTTAHLAMLMRGLPWLRSLTLSDLAIDTLGFLAEAPMTSQLRSLALLNCRQLPVAELRHVHSLRGLRELEIKGSFNVRLAPNDEALMALRPPSSALPLLESFAYSSDYSWRCFRPADPEEEEDEEL